MPALAYSNGVNGRTGGYLLDPQPAADVAAAARVERVAPAREDALRDKDYKANHESYAPLYDDPDSLALSGWAVVFAAGIDPRVRERLDPLLRQRREEAGAHYHEFVWPAEGRPAADWAAFLGLHKVAPGDPADPRKVPYYLLLVGDPVSMPFEFQYGLDLDYAVGRLWLEAPDGGPDLDGFARYAESTVAADGKALLPRRASFFGVRHDDDPATVASADKLVGRLPAELTVPCPDWDWGPPAFLARDATKERLRRLLAAKAPALLFAAAHGLGLPRGDDDQLARQGAVLCDDWPGPVHWGANPVPPECFFAADDLGPAARVHGLVLFLFACYGGGTPLLDDYPHPKLKTRPALAPRPFVARLPQALLAHPGGGAGAVVAHVDRAWPCSFLWDQHADGHLATYQQALTRLLRGRRVGWALEGLNARGATVGTLLLDLLDREKYGYQPRPEEVTYLWTAHHDARAFVVLGDPAVRLCAAAPLGDPHD